VKAATKSCKEAAVRACSRFSSSLLKWFGRERQWASADFENDCRVGGFGLILSCDLPKASNNHQRTSSGPQRHLKGSKEKLVVWSR